MRSTKLFHGTCNGMPSSAVFSACERYRYWLARIVDPTKMRTVTFLMLNPSTADAMKNDPTVARCVAYAKRWEYGCIIVVNLFALRSTDPKVLRTHEDPVGPSNDRYIVKAGQAAAGNVICAWGVHGALNGRAQHVLDMLRRNRCTTYALGETKDGHPRHPLYLRSDARPAEYV